MHTKNIYQFKSKLKSI